MIGSTTPRGGAHAKKHRPYPDQPCRQPAATGGADRGQPGARRRRPATDERFEATLGAAVEEVVRRQRELGIDVPGDGEFGKAMAQSVNYGSWWRYSWQRLSGIEPGEQNLYEMTPQRSRPGEVVLTSFGDRRDRTLFAAAYSDPESGITTGPRPPTPVCVAPLGYAGRDLIRADIANFKAALAAAGVAEGFMTAVAPGSCSRIGNTLLQDRGGVPLRLRRGDARGIQGDRRRRHHPAARRSGARRELGHGQPRADGRGVPANSRRCGSRR